MNIVLTQLEERKLMTTVHQINHYRQLCEEVENSRTDIFQMIAAAHQVDLSKFDIRSTVLKDGILTLTELKQPQ